MSVAAENMISKFLPEDFDPTKGLTLIAGRGTYPILVAQNARAAGVPVKLVAFKDETLPDLWDSFDEEDRRMIVVGQLGKMFKSIKTLGCGYTLMAGQIRPKKLFKGLKPDLKAITMLATLKVRNADTVFGGIVGEIQKMGIQQLDARAFIDSEMASQGLMTKTKIEADRDHIIHGIKTAKGIAEMEIGQAVVVSKGTTLAVEAFEGTDPMLRRVAAFEANTMVFVKTVKKKQNYQFDVPCFGTKTIELLKEAKIKTVALETDSTIIIEKEKTLKMAKKAGISILGYSVDGDGYRF